MVSFEDQSIETMSPDPPGHFGAVTGMWSLKTLLIKHFPGGTRGRNTFADLLVIWSWPAWKKES